MYKFRGADRTGSFVPPDTSTGLPWSQRPPDLPRFTCGLSPLSLVRFFAGLDIFKNLSGIGIFIYLYVLLRISDKEELLEQFANENNEDMIMFLNFPLWLQRGFLIFIMLLFLLSLGFSILLFKAAKQEHYARLRYWFIYQLTMLLIFSALHVWMFFYGWFLPDRPRKIIGSLFLLFFMNYLWQGYHLYVTSLWMTDITYQPGPTNARTRFTFSNIHRETSIVSFRSSRSSRSRRLSWPFS